MKLCVGTILLFVGLAGAANKCINKLDIALVVEDSSTLPDENAEAALKGFLSGVVNQLLLGEDDVHVAYQLYNDQSETIFNLSTYTQTTDAKATVLKTAFSRKDVGAPSIGSALQYTWDEILTVANGERSSDPTVVILVSYSSYPDLNGPNSKAADISIARKLRNAGALVLTVGVGKNRDPALLIDIAGNQSNYHDFENFEDLNEAAIDALITAACNYKPTQEFHPCELENLYADVVFVVDVSKNFDNVRSKAVNEFIGNYLRPYVYGKSNIQAALVTYSKVTDVAVKLTDASDYEDFLKRVQGVFGDAPTGSERYIYNALDTVLYHVLVPSQGFRPSAAHQVFIFTSDCFTGPDPISTADAIRALPNTEMYVVTLNQQVGFWKEFIEVAGDEQHIYEAGSQPDAILSTYLPTVGWRSLCSAATALPTTVAPPTAAPPVATTTEAQQQPPTAAPVVQSSTSSSVVPSTTTQETL